jgi:hypothetical protein
MQSRAKCVKTKFTLLIPGLFNKKKETSLIHGLLLIATKVHWLFV